MGSELSKTGKGSDWKSKVYFDPEADSSSGQSYWINDSELRTKLTELIDAKEDIEEIWVYSHKLYACQLYQGIFMYHAYIVLETNKWYWSIEKNNEGITIQRSKRPSYVIDKYQRTDRNRPITQRNHDKGRMRMKELIDWLYVNNELNQTYSYFLQHSNCQGFAKRIFDRFAKVKTCGPLLN